MSDFLTKAVESLSGGDVVTDDDALRALSEALGAPERWCEALLKIKTKKQEVEDLRWNTVQERLNVVTTELKAQNRPVRLIVLKARQQGVSTWSEARLFERTITQENGNALVIAHKGDSAAELFAMSRFFFENLPFQPKCDYSNRREIVLAPPMNSKMRIESAENKDAGRGMTNQYVHASEVAFWPSPEQTMLGLMQSVPKVPETMVILESTANGVGGYFHDMWWSAIDGTNDFTPVFLPWHENPEYSFGLSEEDTDRITSSLDDSELEGCELFGWSAGQIAWRRSTIANECNGNMVQFMQEYPATPHEAFQASGRPAFQLELIDNILNGGCTDPARGNLVNGVIDNG